MLSQASIGWRDAALRWLAVESVVQLGFTDGVRFSAASLGYVMRRCTSIRSLLVQHISRNGQPAPLSGSFFVPLSLNRSQLEHLEINLDGNDSWPHPGGPGPYGLASTARGCPKLKRLQLRGAFVTEADIQSFLELTNCPLLQTLSVRGRHITTLQCEGTRLVHLEIVDTAMADAALHAVLRGCPALESLDVSRSRSLTGVEADCPRLKRLVAQSCERLTTFGGTLERLKHANFGGCPKLEAVTAVCKALHSLELKRSHFL